MSDIDSKVVEMYQRLEQLGLLRPLAELSPAEQRNQDLETVRLLMDEGAEKKISRTETISISRLREDGEITVKIYHPLPNHIDRNLPMVVFIHGGGFITGEFLSVHETCCLLSSASQSLVASVNYRLAPGYKFPMGLNDCYASVSWAAENASKLAADPSKLVVAGDSAGGNLAAALCILAREKSEPKIALQGLVYPVTDLSRNMTKYTGVKYGPSKQELESVAGHYLRNQEDALNPLVSPLLAELKDLPRAVMITAGNDPLREQDMEYAAKLRKAGVEVAVYDYPSMIHGFFTLPGYFRQGKEAIETLGKHIRNL